MKRRIISLVLLLVILSTLFLTASAEAGIMPRYNNTSSTSSNFTITSTGTASVSAVYNAYRDGFESATITSYIEKRTLGIFWSKVDIGQPNNEWVDTSTSYSKAFVHEFQLQETGTYRATIVYRISGTGGADDVIDYDKTLTYS